MTANVMEADIEKCREAGMQDHIGKPIDPDELWRVLLRWTRVPTLTPGDGSRAVDEAAMSNGFSTRSQE